MNEQHYYISDNGQERGPYELDQLRTMYSSGGLTANAHYWTEGAAGWQLVSQLFSRVKEESGGCAFEPEPSGILQRELGWKEALVVAGGGLLLLPLVILLVHSISGSGIGLLLGPLGILGISLYFIPSFIAHSRKTKNFALIACLNLALGWTGVGWLGLLVWAAVDPPHPDPGY